MIWIPSVPQCLNIHKDNSPAKRGASSSSSTHVHTTSSTKEVGSLKVCVCVTERAERKREGWAIINKRENPLSFYRDELTPELWRVDVRAVRAVINDHRLEKSARHSRIPQWSERTLHERRDPLLVCPAISSFVRFFTLAGYIAPRIARWGEELERVDGLDGTDINYLGRPAVVGWSPGVEDGSASRPLQQSSSITTK